MTGVILSKKKCVFVLDKVYWRFEIQNEKIIVQLKKLRSRKV